MYIVCYQYGNKNNSQKLLRCWKMLVRVEDEGDLFDGLLIIKRLKWYNPTTITCKTNKNPVFRLNEIGNWYNYSHEDCIYFGLASWKVSKLNQKNSIPNNDSHRISIIPATTVSQMIITSESPKKHIQVYISPNIITRTNRHFVLFVTVENKKNSKKFTK